jgi:DNA-binding transcriptional regulator YiaG
MPNYIDREKVFAERMRRGLTQAQAAALVDVTARTWRRWEAGDRRMPAAYLELLTRKKKPL